MDNGLKISIITASYNYAHIIEETIDSVINQTYPYWELIIVDDGSCDGSVELIKKYCETDDRIKFFQHKNGVNKGLKDTILLGLEKASYAWIAFLESDDVFKPNYLEEKVKVIKDIPDSKFIFSDVEFFGDEEKIRDYQEYVEFRKEMFQNEFKYTDLLTTNFIPTFSCVMLTKELLSGCNFNCKIPQWLDWFLWMQIIQETEVVYLQKVLTRWRIHPKSYINSTGEKLDASRWIFVKQLIRTINQKFHGAFLVDILEVINKKRIEKFFRPQVKYINKFILSYISTGCLKKKVIDIKRVNFGLDP